MHCEKVVHATTLMWVGQDNRIGFNLHLHIFINKLRADDHGSRVQVQKNRSKSKKDVTDIRVDPLQNLF